MPTADDYLELMRSPVADLRNAAERSGDALNAAIFLRQFMDDRPWVHIDMAATGWQRDPGTRCKRKAAQASTFACFRVFSKAFPANSRGLCAQIRPAARRAVVGVVKARQSACVPPRDAPPGPSTPCR